MKDKSESEIGLLIFTEKLSGYKEPKLLAMGQTNSICPYCNHTLAKKPAKKTKCPNCGEYIFVRTRPIDRMKILVTEEQTILVEEQWTFYYELHEKEKLESDPEYCQMKTKLSKKWGIEPSVSDVRWALANKYLITYAKDRNWGLYRNTKFEMAEILKKEKRHQQALQTYLEVCYLDINGPENVGGIGDPELLRKYPPFDPKDAYLAPAAIYEIQELAKVVGLTHDDVKTIYLETARINYAELKLPVEPIQGWDKIRKELYP